MGNGWKWLAALVGLTACSGVSGDVPSATDSSVVSDTRRVSDTGLATAPQGTAAALWNAVEVIDGDTLRVIGPDGEQTVRLIGINAPEQGECFYDEATAALQYSLGDRDLRLVSDLSDLDRYRRSLRYVELADGTDVGAELVEGGYARSPHHYEPDVSRNGLYDELEGTAEQAGVGLWAADACGAPFASDVSIAVDDQYNAPGDDNFNLNEEWARFTNTGAAALDLSGWGWPTSRTPTATSSATLSSRPECQSRCSPAAVRTLKQSATGATKTAVWNNGGDTVFPKDPAGNTVVAGPTAVERCDDNFVRSGRRSLIAMRAA